MTAYRAMAPTGAGFASRVDVARDLSVSVCRRRAKITRPDLNRRQVRRARPADVGHPAASGARQPDRPVAATGERDRSDRAATVGQDADGPAAQGDRRTRRTDRDVHEARPVPAHRSHPRTLRLGRPASSTSPAPSTGHAESAGTPSVAAPPSRPPSAAPRHCCGPPPATPPTTRATTPSSNGAPST